MMKDFEYILAKLQGEAPSKTLVEAAKEAKEKAKETALAATEKAKDLASKAATKKQQQSSSLCSQPGPLAAACGATHCAPPLPSPLCFIIKSQLPA